MRRVIYVEAMDNFELILMFDNEEYRILNIRDFLEDVHGSLAEVRADLKIFQTAAIIVDSGIMRWSNGGEIDSGSLYEASRTLKVL